MVTTQLCNMSGKLWKHMRKPMAPEPSLRRLCVNVAANTEVRFNHPQTIMHPILAFSLDLLWEKLVPGLQGWSAVGVCLNLDVLPLRECEGILRTLMNKSW